MKKILFLIAFIACISVIKAEKEAPNGFKAFRVDLGVGYATPLKSDAVNGGFAFSIEPKLTFFQHIGVGLRYEGAMMTSIKKDGTSGDLNLNGSYMITGDYRFNFTGNTFRPVVGMGLGAFTIGGTSADGNNNTASISAQTNFGGMFRAGFDIRHLTLLAEYNIAGKNGNDKRADYLGVKLILFLWGGVKDSN